MCWFFLYFQQFFKTLKITQKVCFAYILKKLFFVKGNYFFSLLLYLNISCSVVLHKIKRYSNSLLVLREYPQNLFLKIYNVPQHQSYQRYLC